MTTYLTTTIPYVNAAPHLGFALEAVEADVLARHAPAGIDDALDVDDYRGAATAILDIVTAANRCIDATTPWTLAKAAAAGDADAASRLDAILALLVDACRVVAPELAPLLPDAAARVAHACGADEVSGRLPVPAKVFQQS